MLKEVSLIEIRLMKGSVKNVSLREVGLSEVDGGRFDRGQWIAVSLLEMSLMEIWRTKCLACHTARIQDAQSVAPAMQNETISLIEAILVEVSLMKVNFICYR